MLKHPCALIFLVLAFSPFTAPFQTYGEVPTAVAVPLDSEHDPGSLVAPLATKSGHLTVAPTAGLTSHFVPVALLTPFIRPKRHIRRGSTHPTILRI